MPGGDSGAILSNSIPYFTVPSVAPSGMSSPSKSHGAVSRFWITYGCAWPPRSLPLYCTPISARFRAAEVAPELHAPDAVQPIAVDAPEEVVGGEERQVAAEVAIALRDVVDVLRHVLLVPREDDQVVELRQVVAGREPLEILVADVVAPGARCVEEPQEAALLRAVMRRLTVS